MIWGKITLSFLRVQQQTDGHNCGIFAIAFAAEILGGASPMDANFDMRPNLVSCLENKQLKRFPKAKVA